MQERLSKLHHVKTSSIWKRGICPQVSSINDTHNVEVKAFLKSEILASNKEELIY